MHRQHYLTAVLFQTSALHIPETETLKQFRLVEKYADGAETVPVFYFSFISPRATGLMSSSGQRQLRSGVG